MRKTFESILEDRGVVRWLNELDRLVEEARKQQVKAQGENGEAVVPPHTLPAMQLYLSYVGPMMVKYSEQIQERHKEIQDEVTERSERVQQQRIEIETIMHRLEGIIADLNASNSTLNPEDTDNLRSEMREVVHDRLLAP